MEGYAYYNGVFAPADEIRVPLTDRALFFGDGVYDAAVGTVAEYTDMRITWRGFSAMRGGSGSRSRYLNVSYGR